MQTMKQKLEECRDIAQEICCDVEGRYPIGVVRIGRLLEEVLAAWWDDDETVGLAALDEGDLLELDLDVDQPFPAA